MDSYNVVDSSHLVAGVIWRMRSLSDLQQYSDPDGEAHRAGVSSAQWPLFGILWPSAVVLAERLATLDLRGLRLLELGCGLGLPSLVAAGRGAKVTATDVHPLAGAFLRHNAAINGIEDAGFVQRGWGEDSGDLGDYDLVLASDVLYEVGQVAPLALLCARHAREEGCVVLVDPGRGQHNRFRRGMRSHGFGEQMDRMASTETGVGEFHGAISTHRR